MSTLRQLKAARDRAAKVLEALFDDNVGDDYTQAEETYFKAQEAYEDGLMAADGIKKEPCR